VKEQKLKNRKIFVYFLSWKTKAEKYFSHSHQTSWTERYLCNFFL